MTATALPREAPEAWTVVVPVKGGATAKSRLGGPRRGVLDGDTTARLALAMAADCVEAVLAAPGVARVLVVTGDVETAAATVALGADVVPQPADRPGLGAAVARGLAAAGDGWTAVLLADLPALRPADVGTALAAAARACRNGAGWVYVPDLGGSGTVAVAAPRAGLLRPAFGPGSAAAHRAAGASALVLDLPRLRGDVDTPADLAAAVVLGVGPRTARTLSGVQATVLSWSAEGSGEVVTDSGVRLTMAHDALEGSGLRHLRPGQRVTCTVEALDGAGRTTAVTGVRIRGISGS